MTQSEPTSPRGAVDPQQWWNGWEGWIHPLFEDLLAQHPSSAARAISTDPGIFVLVVFSVAGLIMVRGSQPRVELTKPVGLVLLTIGQPVSAELFYLG